MANNEKLIIGAGRALDQMKYEIASEFGYELGPDQTARNNGAVGGEMVKRMIAYAEQHMSDQLQ